MTSYMVDFLWRHINLKLHQLGYLYVTWPKSRDVISVRYHVMKWITPENPGNELASFLKKNPDAFGNVWERHFWKNYPFSNISIILMTFLKKTNFGKWVSVIPGKKIQTTFQVWIYFPEMTLTHCPKNIFFKNSWPYTGGCLLSREKAVKDVNSRVEFCFFVMVILNFDWSIFSWPIRIENNPD